MTRTLTRLLVGATLLAAAVAGCGDDGESSAATSAPPAKTAAATAAPESAGVKAEIADFAFAPKTLAVKVGEEVTWTNTDSAPHTVTANDGTFDSGNMQQGDTYTWKAEKPGSYDYICELHPSMIGKITVQ